LIARWKAHVEFLLSVIELLFLSLTVEALQGKMCQNSLPSRGGRSLGSKISGGRGRSWGKLFGLYKTRHILHRATCRRFDTIPACDRQTDGRSDGQTDGIAVASTALVMRALRRAVKMGRKFGRLCPLYWGGKLGPHLAQCGLDQGPPTCQVSS